MSCEQSRHYIDPLIDNELSVDLTSEVMRHLDSCLQCQVDWLATAKLQVSVTEAIEKIAIPPRLVERIRERVELSRGNRGRMPAFRHRFVITAIAATLIVAVIVAFIFANDLNKKASLVAGDLVASYRSIAMDSTPGMQFVVPSQSEKSVNLPGWKLVKVEACQFDKVPARHFCYVNSQKQTLSLYELQHGFFDAKGLKTHSMNGRTFCCGQLKDVSIVYCPSEKNDHVLVSAMSEKELMSIAMKT